MADEVAVVGLEAETSEFDKALGDAEKAVGDWGKAVEKAVKPGEGGFKTLGDALDKFTGRFDAARQSLAGRVDSMLSKLGELGEGASEKLASVAEMSSKEIGQSIGAGLGGLLGARAGLGDFGAKIGNFVGDKLSKVIDFRAIVDGATEMLESIRPIFEDIQGYVGIIFAEAKVVFSEIKDLARSVGIGEIMRGDLTGAWDKITTFVEGAFEKLQGFAFRFAVRLGDAMDRVWNAIKEPIARLADFFQSLLQKVGLLGEGTNKWGDSIRSVGQVARTVFGALAYAVGFVQGLLQKTAGYIQEYVIAPMLVLAENVVSLLAKVFQKVSDTVGGVVGRKAGEAAKFLKDLERDIGATKQEVRDIGRENQKADPFESGQKKFDGFTKNWDENAQNQRNADQTILLFNKLAASVKGTWEGVLPIVKAFGNTLDKPAEGPQQQERKSVTALQQGTAAANNEIAKARSAAATDAAKQIAVAEKQVDILENLEEIATDTKRANERIADRLESVGTV